MKRSWTGAPRGASAINVIRSAAQRRANALRRWALIRDQIVVGGRFTSRPRNASLYASRRTGRAGTWRRRALEAQYARRVVGSILRRVRENRRGRRIGLNYFKYSPIFGRRRR